MTEKTNYIAETIHIYNDIIMNKLINVVIRECDSKTTK